MRRFCQKKFLHVWVICAITTRPPQWKVGMVCLPTNWVVFLLLLFFTLNFSYQNFQEAATVDNYEKLNSSCIRLWQALCSDLFFFFSIVQLKALLSFGSLDGKIRKRRKYECLIPFMRCGSGTACGSVAENFFFTMEWFVPLSQGLHSGK